MRPVFLTVMPQETQARRGTAVYVLIIALVLTAIIAAAAVLFVPPADSAGKDKNNLTFVQLSDTHWGFYDPAVNPDPTGTLPKAIAVINSMRPSPDFVVFTGDLTHTTDTSQERIRRLSGLRDTAATLKIKEVHFLPGEHDAALDKGSDFTETFGPAHYSFA